MSNFMVQEVALMTRLAYTPPYKDTESLVHVRQGLGIPAEQRMPAELHDYLNRFSLTKCISADVTIVSSGPDLMIWG